MSTESNPNNVGIKIIVRTYLITSKQFNTSLFSYSKVILSITILIGSRSLSLSSCVHYTVYTV